jgi:hypothetical protein
MTPKSGKAIAWLSFTLGILVSIAGNIGHAASDGMKPGEWAGAAFWPLALMLTIEILTRVRWQPEKRWTVARFAALILVAMVAAVLSYRHLAGLMSYWGEDPLNAYLGPLAVDGLMLIAATALLSISKERAVVQPESAPVPVSAPEQVPVSDAPPAVEPEPTPVPAGVNGSARDTEISHLVNQLTKPEPDKPKVQTSKTVPSSAAEEAAFQVWMNAPQGSKPSVRKLADMTGLSPSKAHRLITSWRGLETAR